MSQYAFGNVLNLYKYDDGYEVTVEITGEAGTFKLEIRTPHENPADAIEAARAYVSNLGAAMAETFKDAGSLA